MHNHRNSKGSNENSYGANDGPVDDGEGDDGIGLRMNEVAHVAYILMCELAFVFVVRAIVTKTAVPVLAMGDCT